MGILGHKQITETLEHLKKQKFIPNIAVVLGSGLGDFVQNFKSHQSIPYSEIPNFPQTSVQGHEGTLHLVEWENKKIALLQGRVHAYEGNDLSEVVFPVRVMGAWGVKNLILTNASGGINTQYKPADIVMISDHLNLSGNNPLIGENISELGPRFPDMSDAYSTELRKIILKACKEEGISLQTGVYAGLMGPCYETPAEIKMLRTLGADMVGMSTVSEAIAANHMGIKVIGLSCITNMAAGILNQKLSHEEVKETALKAMQNFSNILMIALKKI